MPEPLLPASRALLQAPLPQVHSAAEQAGAWAQPLWQRLQALAQPS